MAYRPGHSFASIGTSSTQVVGRNDRRDYLLIVNDSDTVIYLKIDAAAIVNEGIRLNASGGSYEMSTALGNIAHGPINGIHGGIGTKRLLVTEGV